MKKKIKKDQMIFFVQIVPNLR